jgi:hypothetical protein
VRVRVMCTSRKQSERVKEKERENAEESVQTSDFYLKLTEPKNQKFAAKRATRTASLPATTRSGG